MGICNISKKKITIEAIMKILDNCIADLTATTNTLNQLAKEVHFQSNIDKELKVATFIDEMRTNIANTLNGINDVKVKISSLLT